MSAAAVTCQPASKSAAQLARRAHFAHRSRAVKTPEYDESVTTCSRTKSCTTSRKASPSVTAAAGTGRWAPCSSRISPSAAAGAGGRVASLARRDSPISCRRRRSNASVPDRDFWSQSVRSANRTATGTVIGIETECIARTKVRISSGVTLSAPATEYLVLNLRGDGHVRIASIHMVEQIVKRVV